MLHCSRIRTQALPSPPFDVKLCAPLQGITASDSSANVDGQPTSSEIRSHQELTQTASGKLAALVESEELLTWGSVSAGPCCAVDAAPRIDGCENWSLFCRSTSV